MRPRSLLFLMWKSGGARQNFTEGVLYMKKISSFTIDHHKLEVGIYLSRIDGDVTTYDLRTRKPYVDEVMDNSTCHTVEHMFATFIRNGELGDKILYFGPMGCQTGFYLLVRNTEHRRVLSEIKRVLKEITEYEGEVFGNSEKECGNCHNLDLAKAKSLCAAYLEAIFDKTERDLYYEM